MGDEMSWCIYCHLPCSQCPAWSASGKETKDWTLQDASRCLHAKVIGNAVATMMGLLEGKFSALAECVAEWMDETNDDSDRQIYEWLASPMRWGSEDVMVMTRIFHQLDRGLEEIWRRDRIEERRKELGALTMVEWGTGVGSRRSGQTVEN